MEKIKYRLACGRGILLLCLYLGVSLLTACGRGAGAGSADGADGAGFALGRQEITESEDVLEQQETEAAPDAELPEKERTPRREVTVYFANWYLHSGAGAGDGEVAGLPWDKISAINHAFWKVAPADNPGQSSFDRMDAGLAPRTSFILTSTDEAADFDDNTPSDILPGVPRNHFAQYEVMARKYPEVKILLSVGGWTDSGYFSEMCYTPEGRHSFIRSCIRVLERYWWIDGIDLDWEFPGGSSARSRRPSGSGDEGCPVWGTVDEDAANFASLCKELREALDEKYGKDKIWLTAAASASTDWILPHEDWVTPSAYLTRINVMTYDMTGSYMGVTGHVASLEDMDKAYRYFINRGIDTDKLYMGTQLYGKVFRLSGEKFPDDPLGAPCDKNYSGKATGIRQYRLRRYEAEAVSGYTVRTDEDGRVKKEDDFSSRNKGWNIRYDEKAGAAYMYNNDPDSDMYRCFISYENGLSLQAKIDYMRKQGIPGIVVWASNHDTADYRRTDQLRFTP